MAASSEVIDLNNLAPLDAALYYAQHGIPVFPLHTIDPHGVCSCAKADCANPGKHPCTPHGLLDATTDAGAIRRWWMKSPTMNIGIRTGGESHLVVVDIDPRHGGVASWGDLIAGHPFIDTKEVETGGGGNHLFFRSEQPVLNSQGDRGGIAPGVDVRGEGGYVVAPPSLHASGERYTWSDGALETPTATLPDWLYEAATTASVRVNGHGNKTLDVAEIMEGVAEGGRDWALFQLASKCRYAGLPQPVAERVVLEAAAKCVPPFPDGQARAKVVSAYGRYRATVVDDTGDNLEQYDSDHFSVTTITTLGPVTLEFIDMERDKREISAEVNVHVPNYEPYRHRINMLSLTARNGFRSELDGIYGKEAGWTKVLARCFSKAQQGFETVDRAIPILEIDSPPTMQWAIDGVAPANGPTVLFGAGGASKTYCAIRMAISLALGIPWVGGRQSEQRNVLWIDYETGDTMAAYRTKRVLRALGMHEELPIFYWDPQGVPLPDQVSALRQTIDRHNIGFLMVDHIAASCGGKPEDAEVAMRYQRALERLKLPALLIGHITADGERDPNQVRKPFGSQFWLGLSRAAWFIQRASSEQDKDHALIGFYNKKDSDTAVPDDFAITIDFGRDGEPVAFGAGDIMESSLLNATRGPVWAIWEALWEPLTVFQIAEVTGIKAGNVKTYLNKNKDRFKSAGGGGRGKQALWSRVSTNETVIP
jgi:hypothetical protein